MKKFEDLKPVIKWPGGKRGVLPNIHEYFPEKIDYYIEPFFGGGAVFFHLLKYHVFKSAYISDMNQDLINLYISIKRYPDILIDYLGQLKNMFNKGFMNQKDFYQFTVKQYNLIKTIKLPELGKLSEEQEELINKSAILIFLNKTCFNGLYRVNKKGLFNVPFGKYDNPEIFSEKQILYISEKFNNCNVEIIKSDFLNSFKWIKNKPENQNTFFYIDPPYFKLSKTSSFDSYTEDKFNKLSHLKVIKFCHKLNLYGFNFMLSSSDNSLYKENLSNFKIKEIKAKRSINSKGNSRGKITELIIYNY